jgi:hypothetical protein
VLGQTVDGSRLGDFQGESRKVYGGLQFPHGERTELGGTVHKEDVEGLLRREYIAATGLIVDLRLYFTYPR